MRTSYVAFLYDFSTDNLQLITWHAESWIVRECFPNRELSGLWPKPWIRMGSCMDVSRRGCILSFDPRLIWILPRYDRTPIIFRHAVLFNFRIRFRMESKVHPDTLSGSSHIESYLGASLPSRQIHNSQTYSPLSNSALNLPNLVIRCDDLLAVSSRSGVLKAFNLGSPRKK
jgi:hypothetical protein